MNIFVYLFLILWSLDGVKLIDNVSPPLYEHRGRNIKHDGSGSNFITLHGDTKNPKGTWPWVCSLGTHRLRDKSDWVHICTGVIASENHVITTVGCLEHFKWEVGNYDVVVRAGDRNIKVPHDDADVQIKDIAGYEIHPDYNQTHYFPYHDIAILTTKTPFSFSKYIRPIELPEIKNGEVLRQNKIEEFLIFSDWGGPHRTIAPLLNTKLLLIEPPGICQTLHPSLIITRELMCGLDYWTLSRNCQLDLGSPVIKEDIEINRYVLKGLLTMDIDDYEECENNANPNLIVSIASKRNLQFIYEKLFSKPLSNMRQDEINVLPITIPEEDYLTYEDCGRNSILDGEPIDNSQLAKYPWQVSLGLLTEPNNIKEWIHFCGGSILSPTKILTAAHCNLALKKIQGKIHVRAGDDHLQNQRDNTGVQIREIKEYSTHPKYNKRYFDVGIIILKAPLNMTKFVRPVCLPSLLEAKKLTKESETGTPLTVTGWGLNDYGQHGEDLKATIAVVLSEEKCNETYNLKKFNQNSVPNLFTSDIFCAADPVGDAGTCHGDSGGPAVYYDHRIRRFFLHGIVSGSAMRMCGTKLFPNIYARISDPFVLEWILNQVLATDGTCYEDDGSRLLDDFHYSATNTPDECIKTCRSGGYSYAGVQYETECYCGNDEPPASRIRNSSQCNHKCPGDASLRCGGGWRMNIYTTDKTDAVIHEEYAQGAWDFDRSFGGVTLQIKYKDPAHRWMGGHAHFEVHDLKKLIPTAKIGHATFDITFDGGVAKNDGIFNLKIEYSLEHAFEEKGIFEFNRKHVGNHWITAISNKKNGGENGNGQRFFPELEFHGKTNLDLQTPYVFHLMAPRFLPGTFDAEVKIVGNNLVGTVKMDNTQLFQVTPNFPDGKGFNLMVLTLTNINYKVSIVPEDKNRDGEEDYLDVKVFKNGRKVFDFELDESSWPHTFKVDYPASIAFLTHTAGKINGTRDHDKFHIHYHPGKGRDIEIDLERTHKDGAGKHERHFMGKVQRDKVVYYEYDSTVSFGGNPSQFELDANSKMTVHSSSLLHQLACNPVMSGLNFLCFNNRIMEAKFRADKTKPYKMKVHTKVDHDGAEVFRIDMQTQTSPYRLTFNWPRMRAIVAPYRNGPLEITADHNPGTSLAITSNIRGFSQFSVVKMPNGQRKVTLNNKEVITADFQKSGRTITQSTTLPDGRALTTIFKWGNDNNWLNNHIELDLDGTERKLDSKFEWNFGAAAGTWKLDAVGHNNRWGDYNIHRTGKYANNGGVWTFDVDGTALWKGNNVKTDVFIKLDTSKVGNGKLDAITAKLIKEVDGKKYEINVIDGKMAPGDFVKVGAFIRDMSH